MAAIFVVLKGERKSRVIASYGNSGAEMYLFFPDGVCYDFLQRRQ